MTVKVVLLKSGEQIIADIKEMVSEDKVLGYFLERPYVVHLRNPELVINKDSPIQLEISLFNWIPLSKDPIVPIPTDWVVTIVEPVKKLNDMYKSLIDRIVKENGNEERIGEDTSSDEQSDSDKSD